MSPIGLLKEGDEFLNFSLKPNCFPKQRHSCFPNAVLGGVLVNAHSSVCWGKNPPPPDQFTAIPKAGKPLP